MPKKTLAVKIESKVAERISRYCADRGLKQGFFVEKAIEEKLEDEELKEDLLDMKMNRPHEKDAVSFEEYLARRE